MEDGGRGGRAGGGDGDRGRDWEREGGRRGAADAATSGEAGMAGGGGTGKVWKGGGKRGTRRRGGERETRGGGGGAPRPRGGRRTHGRPRPPQRRRGRQRAPPPPWETRSGGSRPATLRRLPPPRPCGRCPNGCGGSAGGDRLVSSRAGRGGRRRVQQALMGVGGSGGPPAGEGGGADPQGPPGRPGGGLAPLTRARQARPGLWRWGSPTHRCPRGMALGEGWAGGVGALPLRNNGATDAARVAPLPPPNAAAVGCGGGAPTWAAPHSLARIGGYRTGERRERRLPRCLGSRASQLGSPTPTKTYRRRN